MQTPPCPSCEFDPDFVKPLEPDEYWRLCSECLEYTVTGKTIFKKVLVVKEP